MSKLMLITTYHFYSADSLATRILDGKTTVLITADGVWRGQKLIHLLEIADKALEICSKDHDFKVNCNIVVCHLPRLNENNAEEYEAQMAKSWEEPRDIWWHEVMKDASEECKPDSNPGDKLG